jgi:hypothetical protein
MKRFLFFCLLIAVAVPSFGQTCAQTLRLARATYEQGRLHEIESQLKDCLERGFTKAEKQLKVEAYKILCLSYIYLEEPQKADQAMLNLKRTDPYYRPNKQVDPAEFVALYNSFREDPIYRLGFKVGGIFSRPNVQELITAVELGTDSEYKPMFSPLQIGGSFDLPLKLFNQNRWTLHAELLYQQNKFEIDQKEASFNPNEDPDNPTPPNEFEGIETHNRVVLPVLLEYKLFHRENQKLEPYIALGVSTDYLIGSSLTAQKVKSTSFVPEKNEDLNPQREKLNLSGLVAAGVKLPTGPGYLVIEVRYAHGLTNVSSPETALNNQFLALDYGYVDPIYNLSSLSVSGSFVFNKFNPKKLARKR